MSLSSAYNGSKTALAVVQAIAKAIALQFFKQLALNLMTLDTIPLRDVIRMS
ncbi:MAG: hypothetical protein WCS87_09325 [Methylococcaceae bacterium]